MISDIRRWDTQPTWWNSTPLDTGVQGDQNKAERWKSRDVGIQNVRESINSWFSQQLGQARTDGLGSGNRQVFFEIEAGEGRGNTARCNAHGISKKGILRGRFEQNGKKVSYATWTRDGDETNGQGQDLYLI